MTYDKTHSLLSRGTVVNGVVSVSLDDSWTGKSLMEALGGDSLRDVSIFSLSSFEL